MRIDHKTHKVLREKMIEQLGRFSFPPGERAHIMAALESAINRTNMYFNILIPQSEKRDPDSLTETTMIERSCQTCGKVFLTYSYWRMANCKSCRKTSIHKIERIENE